MTEMVGSGPYRFVADEYVNGSRVVYEKFDKYVSRAEPAIWATGAKQAYFPRVVWNIIPDAATAGAALQNNEIDWWEQPLADLLPKLAADKNIALQVDQPWGRISWLILNQAQPPFNDVRIRRAVMMAVRQDDYMRATFGDDQSLWRVSKDVFPFGTPYYSGADGDAMKGDLSLAAKMLQEAGYAGQKVVVMNPTDFAAIHPLGLVTADILKQIGMNVELQETDWGTVVQRRASMEPVEKGGWSAFHTFASSATASSPATHPLITGRGAKGWFGWWDNADARALTSAVAVRAGRRGTGEGRQGPVACRDDRCGNRAGGTVVREDRVPPQHHRRAAGCLTISLERAACVAVECTRRSCGSIPVIYSATIFRQVCSQARRG